MSHDDIKVLLEELDLHRRYLSKLRKQHAEQGSSTPTSVHLEIEDRLQEIHKIKQQLRARGQTIEDAWIDGVDPAEHAQSLFDLLPTDSVPEPKQEALARISRIERDIDGYFVGRNDVLMQIAKHIKQGSHTLVSTGIGGIGKSTLAKAFAFRYGQYFVGGVFWISFADENNIDSEITACGEQMKLFAKGIDLSPSERCELVYQEWNKPTPRLLIFDNCDNVPAHKTRTFLSKYLPASGGCRVLITSRNSEWPRGSQFQRISLEVLERADSIALLQLYREDLSNEHANAIAQELGDLPLALSMAGRYLERYGKDPQRYLQQIASKKKKLSHRSFQDLDEGERSVRAVFDLSFKRLNPKKAIDALAINILTCASYFAPNQAIEQNMLLFKTISHKFPSEEEAEEAFDEALLRLLELGLLERPTAQHVQIHRLSSEYCHTILEDEAAQETVEKVLIEETLKLVDEGIPSTLSLVSTHLRHCYDNSSPQQVLRVGALAHALGCIEVQQINYAKAEKLLKEALDICIRHLGDTYLITAQVSHELGSLYRALGRYKETEPLFIHALGIHEKILGDKHSETASSLNSLAALYRVQGRYKEAEPLLLQALNIREQVLGKQHPETAAILNNLGRLYYAQGRYSKAYSLFRRAFSIREKKLGPNHPDTAMVLNNMGLLYQAQEKYSDAEALLKRALNIREEVLGTMHPETATTLTNLALVYQAQGWYEKAETEYLRAKHIREQVQGLEHPDTASLLNHLAYLYAQQNRYKEAEPLLQQALNIREKVLGAKHPETATTLNHFGLLYRAQGWYGEAEPLFLRALSIREEVFDDSHPDIVSSVNTLALLYQIQERYDKAEQLLVRTLNLRQQKLGIAHRDTIVSMNNLALVYRMQGEYREAERLYKRVLSMHRHLYGDKDLSLVQSLNNLAGIYSTQGFYDEAEALYREALVIQEKNKDSSIATTLNNLAGLYQIQGHYKKAKTHYQQALKIAQSILGAKHPDTQTYAENLRVSRQKQQYARVILPKQADKKPRPSQCKPTGIVKFKSISQSNLMQISFARNLVEIVLKTSNADRKGLQKTLLDQARRYEQQGDSNTAAQLRALAKRLI
jgi:tetratricopeptide (TPR) repeat protein